MRIFAGPRAFPWAERLAEEWRLAGLQVSLETDSSGDADQVRIDTANNSSIESTLYLDRRQTDVAGPYSCFQAAAKQLKAGRKPVDFEWLVKRTFDLMDTWSKKPGSVPKVRNCWGMLEIWLAGKNRAAAAILDWHIAEVYPLAHVGFPFTLKESLLPAKEETAPLWLRRLEVRRLILRSRSRLFEWLDTEEARGLLRQAGALCKDIEDERLALRVEAVFAALLVERDERLRPKGFAHLEKVWRRAEELEDGPGAIEIGQTLAYLQSWWHDKKRTLETLEATAAFAERSGVWAPPRLGHLLRRYRMLVAPSPETVAPLIEELHTVLKRGDGSWMATLDDLDRLKKAHGEEKFVVLVAPFWGEENARRLAAITRYGDDEDDDRQRHLDEEAEEEKRYRERAMDPWPFFTLHG